MTLARLWYVSAVVLCAGCASPGAHLPGSPRDELTQAEVDSLTRARDFFALRDRLRNTEPTPVQRYALALLAQALNQPAASNRHSAAALSTGLLTDSARFRLREQMLVNHLRLGAYREGAALADSLTREPQPAATEKSVADVANVGRILHALAGTPPQQVIRRGAIRIPFRQGRIPVELNRQSRNYIFDTGANLSTIMHSEAVALGLDIRPAGIRVGTSTDVMVTADIGVARQLTIGDMEFGNVVFLVMPDSLLTFGDVRIDGIIGFPVIAEMGEVRLRPAGELEVPAQVPARTQANLVLSGLTPLSVVRWRQHRLLCRIDTGANTTDFYLPFYQRFAAVLNAEGTRADRRVGGAGGVRTLPVVQLSNVALEVGDTTAQLARVDVLTRTIVEAGAQDYLDCNVGQDVFSQFAEYVFNFRDMSFLLQ